MELQDFIVILFLIFNELYYTVILITPSCDQHFVGFFFLFLMMILHVVRWCLFSYDLHFPNIHININDVELILCLLVILYILWRNIHQIFCSFALLFLNFRGSLYILNDNCFSNMWFPNLFYHFHHFVCCPFTLYILFLWILIYLFYFYWCLWCYYVFFKNFMVLGLTLRYLGLFWVDFCGVR